MKMARSDAVLMQVASEGPTKPFPGPKPTMFVQCDDANRASFEVSPQWSSSHSNFPLSVFVLSEPRIERRLLTVPQP